VRQQLTVASGRTVVARLMDKFFNTIRRNTGLAVMFGNAVNALQNASGFSNATVYVKPAHLKIGLDRWLADPTAAGQFVSSESKFMNEKLHGQLSKILSDIDLALDPSAWGKVKQWTTEKAYALQSMSQNVVDVVTWLGAFDQSKANAGPELSPEEAHRAAVQDADAAVRLAQGSTNPTDVAAYQVGTPLVRNVTQFSGYWNTVANQLLHARPGQRIEVGLRAFVVPALIAAGIYAALSGGWDDKDHDGNTDEFFGWFFGSLGKAGLSLVPGFGPALASMLSGGRPGDRLSLSPAFSSIQAGVRGIGSLIGDVASGDQVSGQTIRDVASAIAVASGVPVTALGRPVGYGLDVARGKAKPSGPLDVVGGLLTGR